MSRSLVGRRGPLLSALAVKPTSFDHLSHLKVLTSSISPGCRSAKITLAPLLTMQGNPKNVPIAWTCTGKHQPGPMAANDCAFSRQLMER